MSELVELILFFNLTISNDSDTFKNKFKVRKEWTG